MAPFINRLVGVTTWDPYGNRNHRPASLFRRDRDTRGPGRTRVSHPAQDRAGGAFSVRRLFGGSVTEPVRSGRAGETARSLGHQDALSTTAPSRENPALGNHRFGTND